ncbi:hypothetical protein KFK09_023910 [Dendrobium nobile]|uniref:Non-haem dioxygenase N-terminal domain-containing protein n=1 Tax=Dendrobium nobile TaxID=94219 RepID=A0A8T3AHT1_DENNO|nr:hypothetical protein KFK09_023910 [Dendrobium nobile]
MATKTIPPTSRVEILANSGLCTIPAEFVRAESERKDIVDALNNGGIGHGIPILDLGGISSEEGRWRWRCVEEVKAEATEWGVMLIVNHGVQDEIIERLQASGRGFFDLPVEAKEKHANDQSSGQIQGYGSKLANNANGKLEWQGYFFHLVYPKEKADLDIWPTEPADYICRHAMDFRISLS